MNTQHLIITFNYNALLAQVSHPLHSLLNILFKHHKIFDQVTCIALVVPRDIFTEHIGSLLCKTVIVIIRLMVKDFVLFVHYHSNIHQANVTQYHVISIHGVIFLFFLMDIYKLTKTVSD